MNIAIIFAGGYGRRMNSTGRPKQFLEYAGKPIIIYTLELFDNHPEIGGIVIACLKEWIPYLHQKIEQFKIKKVLGVVPGGDTGQQSIFLALQEAERIRFGTAEKDIVLIHDGVRPLINAKTISDNILAVKEFGSCITCVAATESAVIQQGNGDIEIPSRPDMYMVRAPQSFYLKDILSLQRKAISEGRWDFIDSCTMSHHYGRPVHLYIGPSENIKITTAIDYHVFKAMVESMESRALYGIVEDEK